MFCDCLLLWSYAYTRFINILLQKFKCPWSNVLSPRVHIYHAIFEWKVILESIAIRSKHRYYIYLFIYAIKGLSFPASSQEQQILCLKVILISKGLFLLINVYASDQYFMQHGVRTIEKAFKL